MRALAATLCVFCLCLIPCLASGGGLALNAENPRYADEAAGFSFALPPGQWHVEKSEDGRAAIYDRAKDDADATRVDAYAFETRADLPLRRLIDEEEKGYMEILSEEIAPDKNGFILTALSDSGDIVRIHHIHYVRRGSQVVVVALSTPKKHKSRFYTALSKVEQSLAFGDPRQSVAEDIQKPAQAGSAEPERKPAPAGDAEAVKAFWLAEAGDAAKANTLGTWYEKGKHGLPRDGKEAFAWYSKAASLGSALALHNMGDCYRDGIGVPRDREKELESYLRCAAKGHAIGYEDVGDSLLRHAPAGLGADAKTAALRWYAKAASHGRKSAAAKLARMGKPAPAKSASPLPVCGSGRFDLATAECR